MWRRERERGGDDSEYHIHLRERMARCQRASGPLIHTRFRVLSQNTRQKNHPDVELRPPCSPPCVFFLQSIQHRPTGLLQDLTREVAACTSYSPPHLHLPVSFTRFPTLSSPVHSITVQMYLASSLSPFSPSPFLFIHTHPFPSPLHRLPLPLLLPPAQQVAAKLQRHEGNGDILPKHPAFLPQRHHSHRLEALGT